MMQKYYRTIEPLLERESLLRDELHTIEGTKTLDRTNLINSIRENLGILILKNYQGTINLGIYEEVKNSQITYASFDYIDGIIVRDSNPIGENHTIEEITVGHTIDEIPYHKKEDAYLLLYAMAIDRATDKIQQSDNSNEK